MVPDYVVQDDVRRGEVLTTLDDWRLSIFGTQMFMLYMPNRQHTRATPDLHRVHSGAGGFDGRAWCGANTCASPVPAALARVS